MEKDDVKSLNKKQKEAYDAAVSGENVFITGPSGTGKSLVINTFRHLNSENRTIAMTSTTGVSALLVGGTTLHSYLGIELGTKSVDALTQKILATPYLRNRWKKLDTLIIDEISMLSPVLFDKLEAIANNVRYEKRLLNMSEDKRKPFGGIQLILTGDFLQLPVVGSDKFCFEAKSWEKCIDKVCYLTEIMRQTDIEFQTCLNELRFGKLSTLSKNLLMSCLNKEIKNDSGIKPTKIFTTNADVDRVNTDELHTLLNSDENLSYLQYDMDVYVIDPKKVKPDAIEKYRKNCVAPDVLELCEGAQVMLLHNLDLESGLANGSRGVVTSFIEEKPVVKFLNGEERIIDLHTWDFEMDDKPVVRITQIPLKLAWAITCHKSQGCTLDYAEVDLGNVFEYGMSYVALSRVKTKDGLCIKDINLASITAHPKAVEFYKNLSS